MPRILPLFFSLPLPFFNYDLHAFPSNTIRLVKNTEFVHLPVEELNREKKLLLILKGRKKKLLYDRVEFYSTIIFQIERAFHLKE